MAHGHVVACTVVCLHALSMFRGVTTLHAATAASFYLAALAVAICGSTTSVLMTSLDPCTDESV